MEFIKRISHSSFFATGAGERKLRRLAVCALLAAASLPQFNSRRAQVGPVAAARSEAAIRRLKTDGGYATLAAALAAGRHHVFAPPPRHPPPGPSDAPYYANNPGQRLRTTFAPDEVRVSAASNKPSVDASGKISDGTGGAELRLRLAGAGYGEQLEPLMPGVLTANGDRIEIKKTAIRNPQSAITEWYVNKPEGLEQGFTLAAPPARGRAGEWLRVALAVGEGWRAGVRGDGQGAFFERKDDGLRLSYDHLVAYDAHGRMLPARMAPGMELEGGALSLLPDSGALSLLVDDTQAVYPLTIDPILTQQQKLTAADGAANDNFGYAVALSGNTLVIGAPDDDEIGEGQGSVYVFTRSGANWTQQQKLTANDGAESDQFGGSVAISGDTMVVGAPLDHIGGNSGQGAAYVFVRNGAVWTQQQKLIANDGAVNDFFGLSVAVSGDTVAVGAFGDDIGANGDQGSAYVFTRSGTVWTQRQKLTANDGAAGAQFGFSVAISGDTVVVGANTDKFGENLDQGSAYVFIRSGKVWTQQQKLTAEDGAAGAQFGLSVAVSGDTVVVGAPTDDIGENLDQGAAYVFTRNGTFWTQRQKLTAGDGAAGDLFGISVALSGDTLVVGAEGDDIGGSFDVGSTYVFAYNGTVWTQRRKLTADDGAAVDRFGHVVAISGDTVVVGVPLDDIATNKDQGSAYVFVICANNHVQQQQLIASDGATNDSFGLSVALSGDTAVIGAPFDDVVGADQGSAYVFVRSGATWMQQKKLTADDGAANDLFGYAVAISGDTVVAGAPFNANTRQGSAYVFVRSGGVWTQQKKLIATDGAAGDQFGASVALSGDTVVVGAPNDDIGANVDQGSAYVFTRTGADWTQQKKLTAADGAASDFFGFSVAVSSDTVVVGAPNDDIDADVDQGWAYIFTRSGAVWTQQKKRIDDEGADREFFGD